MTSDDQFAPRLCHVRRWPDFNGYGFNLHAEKGKTGQFIGAIDPGSPAEAAGLKPGDRIVEVNGTNVGNENHQQVVQRIKAVPNETKLLVVDAETDDYFIQSKSVVRGDMPGVVSIEAEDKTANGTATSVTTTEPEAPPAPPVDETSPEADVEGVDVVDMQESEAVQSFGAEMASAHKARLCHLKIWSDFSGYGFNLHAEKNKPGQYIGKVDEGSPAESAGLREHDKIIEVNGDNIATVNHQGVVSKIKSDPKNVKLLVLDPEALVYFEGRGIVVTSDSEYTDAITCPDAKPAAAASDTPKDHPHTARLCHIRVWPDSQGYGFNMHTQKSKTGQFIGKVDADSPAEYAGLRDGDRIIEVNGESVLGGDHAMVVQKIKAISGETKLLVLDPEADDYFRTIGMSVTGDMNFVVYKATPQSRPDANGMTEAEMAPPQMNGGGTHDEDIPEPETIVSEEKHLNVDDNENIQEDIISDQPTEVVMQQTEVVEENNEVSEEPLEVAEEPTEITEEPTVVEEEPAVVEEVAVVEQAAEVNSQPAEVNSQPAEVNSQPAENNIAESSPEPSPQPAPLPLLTMPEPVNSTPVSEAKAAPVATPKSPVVVAGIEFAASAKEARQRMSKKRSAKDDARSMKDKYELFQRM